MKKNIALIIIYLLVCVQLHAQLIKGKVVDEHNVPIPLVNVALLSEGDSTLIKGVVTDKDGVFNIESHNHSNLLRFSFIGYQNFYKTCIENDVGVIKMKEISTELSGVTVKAKRPTIKMSLDKVTVDISNSYLQHLGKVTDILKRIPGLTSNFQLLEGGSPTFVLNGKVTTVQELAAIPSSEIKRIIVDSSPSAEYSASNKGVVYITTKTLLSNTLSSELSNTSVFARHYMDMVDLTINERYKKVTNLLTVGYSYIKSTQIDNTTETVYLPQQTIESAKERRTHSKGNIFNCFYSMDWDINKRHSMGIQYTGNVSRTNEYEPTLQTMNGNEMAFFQWKDGNNYMHSTSINYNNKIDATRNLSFVADYTFQYSHDTGLADINPVVKTNSEGRYHITGARLSYRTQRKWADLSMGVFGSTMSSTGAYLYNTDAEDYKTNESLIGAYFSLSKRFKGFYLQGGLRMETNSRKLETNTSGMFTDSTEWHFFPNLVMKKNLTKNSSIGLSIGQTIARPSFNDLNPGLYYYDAISYSAGNPQLKPSITTNLKVSYQYNNFHTSVVYNKNKNKIIQLPIWTDVSIDNKNIKWIPINFDKSSTIVATAIYHYSLGPIQGDITGSFTKPFVKANYLGNEYSCGKPSWYFSVDGQWALSSYSMFAFDGSYDSGGNSTLFNHEQSWTMNLTYMHRLFKDKFTLLVAFNDVFHTDHGNNWTMKYNNIKTSMHTNGDTRSLIVKLSYNLGKLQLDKNKQTASKELLDRL